MLTNHIYDEVKFDEASHTYTIDNKRILSVTTLLKLDNPHKYEGIPEQTLAKASEKGTEVHNAIECYEKYGLEREDLQEFRDYKWLKKTFGFNVIGSELMVRYKYLDVQIIGTTDLVISYKGGLALADIKRTSALDKEYLAKQLNLYRLAFQQTFCEPIEHLVGIHLREGKRKFIELPINQDLAEDIIRRHIDEIREYEKEIRND